MNVAVAKRRHVNMTCNMFLMHKNRSYRAFASLQEVYQEGNEMLHIFYFLILETLLLKLTTGSILRQ